MRHSISLVRFAKFLCIYALYCHSYGPWGEGDSGIAHKACNRCNPGPDPGHNRLPLLVWAPHVYILTSKHSGEAMALPSCHNPLRGQEEAASPAFPQTIAKVKQGPYFASKVVALQTSSFWLLNYVSQFRLYWSTFRPSLLIIRLIKEYPLTKFIACLSCCSSWTPVRVHWQHSSSWRRSVTTLVLCLITNAISWVCLHQRSLIVSLMRRSAVSKLLFSKLDPVTLKGWTSYFRLYSMTGMGRLLGSMLWIFIS